LTEVEIEALSPMRLPGVNKPLSIAFGTGELPAMNYTPDNQFRNGLQAWNTSANVSGMRIAQAMKRTAYSFLRAPSSGRSWPQRKN
jgi:hypothetical protein